MAAKESEDNSGRLIDTARTAPAVIETHGRPVMVVHTVEEYERLEATVAKKAGS